MPPKKDKKEKSARKSKAADKSELDPLAAADQTADQLDAQLNTIMDEGATISKE